MPCLRIAYAGTPEFSVPALEALLASEHQVIVAITQPDRRSGRGKKLSPSAVKTAAVNAHIPVLQPININAIEVIEELEKLDLDIIIVAAFGQLFSKDVLAIGKFGCINIHASLLPKWRGASPIQHAILAGDKQTGVSIMQMQKGMDAGDVWLQSSCVITTEDTSESLHQRLGELSGGTLLQAIEIIVDGEQVPKKQVAADVTYCAKIQKNDGLIDWSDSAQKIIRELRAYQPWPGIFTFIGERRVRIVSAVEERSGSAEVNPGVVLDTDKAGILVSCGINSLRIQELVPAGGKQMKAADFANANPMLGLTLGQH